MEQHSFPVNQVSPIIRCIVFEDNSGALKMVKKHTYRPRITNLNVKLRHFRDYGARGEFFIKKIDAKSQLSDYLTKPANEEILCKLCKVVMGWQ